MDRVNWVVHESISAALRLRALDSAGHLDVEAVHASARGRVDRLLARAAEAGFGSEDARLIAYAVVALLDEVAMVGDGPLRVHWASKPLQRHFFDESVAGERFFEHLARVLADPARVDVLRVFHLVLALGFQGRHRLDGAPHALAALRARVHAQLARQLDAPATLSPDAVDSAPPRRPAGVAPRWWWACTLSLAAVIVLSLRVSLELTLRELQSALVDASRAYAAEDA